MNNLLLASLLFPCILFGQSYAPAADQPGTTAIDKNSPLIVGWATGVEIIRGYVNIEDTTIEAQGSNKASFGVSSSALGPAEGNSADIVSLGDSGIAVLTFSFPIMNGAGFDFAIFENSFSHDYLEFAHVEVSSDGINYVRFPSHSEVQSNVQIHGFGLTDPRRIHNLAGKYKGGYGTPFDLEELKDSSLLDVNKITHVKLIDVIGSVGSSGTFDSYGNKINEPFPTPYETGGFDLDAVAVINQFVGLNQESILENKVNIYPNPSSGNVYIDLSKKETAHLYIRNITGEITREMSIQKSQQLVKIDNLPKGIYIVSVISEDSRIEKKLVVN